MTFPTVSSAIELPEISGDMQIVMDAKLTGARGAVGASMDFIGMADRLLTLGPAVVVPITPAYDGDTSKVYYGVDLSLDLMRVCERVSWLEWMVPSKKVSFIVGNIISKLSRMLNINILFMFCSPF